MLRIPCGGFVIVGRIANITAAMKQREQFTNLAVDPCNLVFLTGSIDGSIVSFIVNQQHGLANHLRTLMHRVLLQPLKQILQGARVLLDHQDHGYIVLANLIGIGRGSRLVEIANCVG